MGLLLAVLIHMPPALMYHRIDTWSPRDRVSKSLTISPEDFSAQLEALKAHGLRGVGVNDFFRCLRRDCGVDRLVLVTFDDGYSDQFTYALPILLRYHMTATFFITTGMIGKARHLTWRDVEIIVKDGMSVGGHNFMHVGLAALNDGAQSFEIQRCIDDLRAFAHVFPAAYAYPGGTLDRYAASVLESEGIVLAFTTDAIYARWGVSARYELTRIRVTPSMSIAALLGALTLHRRWVVL
jgi:peptidoglycan/xylan/chitin deacetylase (PgdA/CDA1 family)